MNRSFSLILIVGLFTLSAAQTSDTTTSVINANALISDSTSNHHTGESSTGIVPWKLATFTTATTLSTGVLFYTFLSAAWWDDKTPTKFYFKDDFEYVDNFDKIAHFYGGYAFASFFADGLLWSGVSPHTSYASAWVYSTLVQVAIDYKDGLTPGFGFSKWDVIAGSTGGALPWIEYAIWGEQNQVDLKFSYYKNSNIYKEHTNEDFSVDDYTNQTFWLSYYPFLNSSNYWKKIFGAAIGFSMDEGRFTRGFGKGKWEIYLSLDYNIEEMFYAQKQSPFIKGLLRYLNHVKLPSPTIQIYPKSSFKLIYPIDF